jgi:AcrR family transcriptional regulator
MTATTRDRILDVARDLFTEQGYEATSLREIADRLGFTKAALYYHFQSKEELMLALLAPIDELVDRFFVALEESEGVEGWAEALAWVIGQMEGQMPSFRLMQRNRGAIEQLGWGDSRQEHLQMHERLQRAVRHKSNSLHDQVRMVCSLGAVTGFDDWAPDLMADTPPARLAAELNATVRDILGLPPVADAVSAGAARSAGP